MSKKETAEQTETRRESFTASVPYMGGDSLALVDTVYYLPVGEDRLRVDQLAASYADGKVSIEELELLLAHALRSTGRDRLIRPTVQPRHKLEPIDWPRENIFPGVTCIIGDTGAGKTHYISEVAQHTLILRVNEPYESIDDDELSYTVSSLAVAAFMAKVVALAGGKPVIDSVKELVYAKGSAMAGGLSAGLFSALSDLNHFFAASGCQVILTVNPMLSDNTGLPRLANRLSANVAGVVTIDRGTVRNETYRLTTGRQLGNDQSLQVDPSPKPRVLDGSEEIESQELLTEGWGDDELDERDQVSNLFSL